MLALIGLFAVVQVSVEDWPWVIGFGFAESVQVGGSIGGDCREKVPVALVVLFPNSSTAVTIQVQPVRLGGFEIGRLNAVILREAPAMNWPLFLTSMS